MVQIKAFSYNPNANINHPEFKNKRPRHHKPNNRSQTTLRLRQQFQGQVPRRIRQKLAALRRK